MPPQVGELMAAL